MTVFLVRHASASKRDPFDPDDIQRQLDDFGKAQARGIAEDLATHRPAVIESSPAPRCLQTVEPLAQALSLTTVTTDSLLEGADIQTAWALLEPHLDEMAGAVLCSHGDVIPSLLQRLLGRGWDVPSLSTKKGSIWELDPERRVARYRRPDALFPRQRPA